MEQVASFENTEITPTDAKGGYHFFNSCLVGISISYLMTSYLTRVTRLYAPVATILDHWFKIVPQAFLQKCYQSAESKQRRSVRQRSYAYQRFTVLVVVVLAEAFYEVHFEGLKKDVIQFMPLDNVSLMKEKLCE
ncbi:MAG: hypothetical protein Q9185_007141 [Variospora sp. 1 TL-2023]